MKKLLSLTALLFPALLFAQQKSRNIIKDFLYVKVSPALYAFAEESDNLPPEGWSPAVFGVVGAKMRYAAVGFSIGSFKLKNGATSTPRGVDLTITDFKQKVFPVLTAQWHQAHFTEATYSGRYSTRVEGKDMYSVGAGGAFSVLKSMKMMLTAGVSKMDCNAVISRVALGPNQPASHYYFKGHYKMLFIALSVVW